MEGKDLRSSLHSLRDHQERVKDVKGEDEWSGDIQVYTIFDYYYFLFHN